jgi:hypothetical protein
MGGSFTRVWIFALMVAQLLACQSNDKAAELAAKEAQLAAREQQLKADTLAAREQAVALREQAAARATAAATTASAAAPEAAGTPSATATVQPTRTVAAAPEAPSQPVPLVPRPVLLTATVTVDMVKPDGQQWDGLGDAPDPRITATVQRSGQSATSDTKNSLSATASLQLNLQVGDTVMITVVDKDLSAHDPIGSFTAMYFGGPTLQQGKLGAGSIAVSFSGPMTD